MRHRSFAFTVMACWYYRTPCWACLVVARALGSIMASLGFNALPVLGSGERICQVVCACQYDIQGEWLSIGRPKCLMLSLPRDVGGCINAIDAIIYLSE